MKTEDLLWNPQDGEFSLETMIAQFTTMRPTTARHLDVHFVSTNSIVWAKRNTGFRRTLNSGWIAVPDGIGAAFWLKTVFARRARRIPGPDFFNQLMKVSQNTKFRHLIFCSSEMNALKIDKKMALSGISAKAFAVPQYEINGIDAKYELSIFRKADYDFVWIGIGTPNQNVLASRLSESINVPVFAVGAAVDLYLLQNRAPKFIRQIGFEWLYRLVTEPKRLWKRYSIEIVYFFYLLALEVRRENRIDT